MAEDEEQPDASEPVPPEQLPSDPDPALTSWVERGEEQADEAERRNA
jgi:hypothetical protein